MNVKSICGMARFASMQTCVESEGSEELRPVGAASEPAANIIKAVAALDSMVI